MTFSLKRAAVFTGAVATAAVLTLSGAVAAQAADPLTVSIRVALDLPSNSDGPRVFEVTNVPVGDGPELTEVNEVSNPSDWCGTVSVDVDANAKTITIVPGEICNFETVELTVTSSQFKTVTLVSDELLTPDDEEGEGPGDGEGGDPSPSPSPSASSEPELDGAEEETPVSDVTATNGDGAIVTPTAGEPAVLTYGLVAGVVSADWVVPNGDSYDLDGPAVFAFTYAALLPATGVDAQSGLIVGGSILALGGVLFVVARRKTATA